ncbi:hypothetical protein [Nocardia sp. NPDC059228]|uniref:hypothetical protein n=1 Tax=Nocardia sp. NPDC059228 TaxID=3346777 RepID=UPI00369BB91B
MAISLSRLASAFAVAVYLARADLRVGCNVISFIDVSDAEYRMWGFEPNIIDHHETDGSPYVEDIETALYREEFGFTEWLRRWTDGTLHQPHLILDEDTGQWRGPTDADGPCWSRYAEGESWTVTLTDPPF